MDKLKDTKIKMTRFRINFERNYNHVHSIFTKKNFLYAKIFMLKSAPFFDSSVEPNNYRTNILVFDYRKKLYRAFSFRIVYA